eukprot:6959922-Lingulodinium_polyedra.AAC.1
MQSKHAPYGRVDGPSVDSDTRAGGNPKPSSVTGNHKQKMQPTCLLNTDGEAGEIVNVGGPLRRLDDRVVPDGPEEHARGGAHADAAH